jgi:2-keto-4-pentenoate hydratase/2-oxohepta-3-ene-1,7-dioic acid hydratase in catechol pathway
MGPAAHRRFPRLSSPPPDREILILKLATFSLNGSTRVGKVVGERIIGLSIAAPDLPKSLLEILQLGRPALDRIRAIPDSTASLPLDSVLLKSPISNPQKFLAIGMNYQAHAEEARAAGIPIPTSQLWFNKQVSCINGPFSPVEMPKVSDRLDYEGEMGVVIGKRCRHVSVKEARKVIAGYMVMNDVSVRDWQARSPTFTLGKSFDTHGPMGPWITTDDEVADPHALALRVTVNGELRQSSSTGDMIYNIFEQIAYLSTVMTLEPGDLLATGTPAGVGIALNKFLKVGDVVRVDIEGLGHIENRIVPET